MEHDEGGPTTLAKVAAAAGVSIATVSKVLNGRADVGPATRARVQTLLQEYEYIGAVRNRRVEGWPSRRSSSSSTSGSRAIRWRSCREFSTRRPRPASLSR